MSISLASLQRVSASRPPLICIHGTPGAGKTTFASYATECVFIRTEDGLGNLTATAFPLAKTFDDVMDSLTAIYTEANQFQWVVIDTLSALEPLIWDAVCKSEGKQNIEELGYGRGYVLALNHWRRLLDALSGLASDKGIGSILLAHTDIVRFEPPDMESYDRAQIKLHKRAFQLVYERCDIIGYLTPRVAIKKEQVGMTKNDTRNLGTTTGERLLYLAEKPAYIAKNRYRLPELLTIPIENPWAPFEAALTASVTPQTQSAKAA